MSGTYLFKRGPCLGYLDRRRVRGRAWGPRAPGSSPLIHCRALQVTSVLASVFSSVTGFQENENNFKTSFSPHSFGGSNSLDMASAYPEPPAPLRAPSPHSAGPRPGGEGCGPVLSYSGSVTSGTTSWLWSSRTRTRPLCRT